MTLELEEIDTAIPAVVTKVNDDGTVDCKPSIRKVYPNGVFDLENSDIPSVPLMKLGGANAEFSFPVKVDDRVILVAFSRDASKWREADDDSDVTPDSAGGLSLMDLVAVPFVKSTSEGAAKVRVTDDGDIVFTPASGRRTICDSDLLCRGSVLSIGEVAAGCQEVEGEVVDTAAVHLTTHIHTTAVGPSGPPNTGS